ncbi:hypothetical protein [Nitrosomonas sp. Is37]|nr:hypothetical protein [Nitrosomonas sp. Is37]MDV6343953.1 hypothetical protein [Nitrosomonas sp. Is37]
MFSPTVVGMQQVARKVFDVAVEADDHAVEVFHSAEGAFDEIELFIDGLA